MPVVLKPRLRRAKVGQARKLAALGPCRPSALTFHARAPRRFRRRRPSRAPGGRPALADLAHGVGARLVVDNTFATPYLTRPREHGVDVVVHSATKYLGGHGDLVAGVVAGPSELTSELRSHGLRHVGAVLGPFESFLLLRGTKTLPVRMERHCDNAEKLARGTLGHPAVAAVHWIAYQAWPWLPA